MPSIIPARETAVSHSVPFLLGVAFLLKTTDGPVAFSMHLLTSQRMNPSTADAGVGIFIP
jgi:hypothetical protein